METCDIIEKEIINKVKNEIQSQMPGFRIVNSIRIWDMKSFVQSQISLRASLPIKNNLNYNG